MGFKFSHYVERALPVAPGGAESATPDNHDDDRDGHWQDDGGLDGPDPHDGGGGSVHTADGSDPATGGT
eukprot:120934-Rhodomonas_salina.2